MEEASYGTGAKESTPLACLLACVRTDGDGSIDIKVIQMDSPRSLGAGFLVSAIVARSMRLAPFVCLLAVCGIGCLIAGLCQRHASLIVSSSSMQ